MALILHLVLLIASTMAVIQERPMPKSLCYCLSDRSKDATKIAGELILYSCITEYLGVTYLERFHLPDVIQNEEVQRWIRSLFRVINGKEHNIRKKRQAGLRHGTRREYRTLSDNDRNRFHRALQRMKDTVVSGRLNRYDALASAHDGRALAAAHSGPAFFPWHREYLNLFEAALQQIDRSVTLPYWDSRLDYNLRNPRESILWSQHFLGNHDGIVFSGPFSRWRQRNGALLERNGGSSGSMISPDGVRNVLSRRRYRDISMPWSRGTYSLENYHNAVHVWVGGSMGGLNTAPSDPAFFLHHAFIDCIWEQFRRRQTGNRETDYPYDRTVRSSHHPQRLMANLESSSGRKRNIQGLSNDYTNRYYRCERSPQTCRDCRRRQYLKCGERVRSLCAARRRPSRSSRPSGSRFRIMNSRLRRENDTRDLGITEKFSTTIHDTTRRKRSASDWNENETSLNDQGVRDKRSLSNQNRRKSTSGMDSSMQNSFVLDGVPDINRWVFIPVKVTHMRPPGLVFGSKVMKNGQLVNGEVDVFSFNSQKNNLTSVKQCKQASFSHSNNYGSGVDRVFVQSEGFSYNGKYIDYAIVDSRLPVSEAVTFIGVKNPNLNSSISYLSAYDSHGRICHPHCLVSGSNPPQYKKCSGVINVTTGYPIMYGENIPEATKLLYTTSSNGIPVKCDKNIFLNYHCEYYQLPWKQC